MQQIVDACGLHRRLRLQAERADVRQQQRAREEEAQRAQNTLPAWHLASTVSGEQTGLGKVDAERRAEEASVAEASAAPEALDVDVDVDYYTRYASQLDHDAKRAAEPEGTDDAPQKRARTDAEAGAEKPAEKPAEAGAEASADDDEDLEMDDVI